jgi:hypothetical protein
MQLLMVFTFQFSLLFTLKIFTLFLCPSMKMFQILYLPVLTERRFVFSKLNQYKKYRESC